MPKSCDPGRGKTILAIGQDLDSIQAHVEAQRQWTTKTKTTNKHHKNYIGDVPSFRPAATMFYTDIQTLRGMETPVDYGSGIEYAQGLVDTFATSGIQIGLWLNGTTGCQEVVSGSLDRNIQQFYTWIHQWATPKVFLRVGYEFDNPYFGYSQDPVIYRQAFQHMVQACEDVLGYESCHRQVAFCWHSWAAPRWFDSLEDFYPGDDYVDWVGISVFQQLYPWATEPSHFAGGSRKNLVEVLELAQHHGKPVMIAESTPFGGIYVNGNDTDIWSLWFEPVLELIEEYDIRMWSYIDCDWDVQPMWHHVGFGDSRLVTSSEVMRKWQEQVLENPRYIMAPLDCNFINAPAPAISALLISPTKLNVMVLPSFPFVALLVWFIVAVGMGLIFQGRRPVACHHREKGETELMVQRCSYGSMSKSAPHYVHQITSSPFPHRHEQSLLHL